MPQAEADGLIEGRNAVTEALRAGTPIDKIFLARGETDATLGHIAAAARDKGVVVVECDRRKLDFMSRTHSHQGVIAQAAVREYASVDDILNAARENAECAGAHGVIIPKRRSAGLTAVVAKTSAGAVSHIPVARVPNLTACLKELKDEGLWVFGADAAGDRTLYEADLKGPAAIVIGSEGDGMSRLVAQTCDVLVRKGPAAIVIGSEGDGMSRLVAQTCDVLVRIPMKGRLNSLNASAAAAILLYEAVRQRLPG